MDPLTLHCRTSTFSILLDSIALSPHPIGGSVHVLSTCLSDHQLSNHQLSNHQLSDHQLSDHQLSEYQLSNHQLFDHQLSDHQLSDHLSDHCLVTCLNISRTQVQYYSCSLHTPPSPPPPLPPLPHSPLQFGTCGDRSSGHTQG